MKIGNWQHRIANWKRTRNQEEPLEFHLLRIYEEVGEAVKELRKGVKPHEIYYDGEKPEGFAVELAQAVLQCMWVAEICGIDLENAMEADMDYKERARIAS